ncbi:MAG TPA: serine/threonine-protein kinase [Pirellulales bacterium]|nr:serine/threonine-protein kinase [Pirellulales bacterium]
MSRAPKAPPDARAAEAARRERLGSWELIEQIGAGEFSEIFRARPANRGDDATATYAVKRLKREYARDMSAVAQLRREARVGSAVTSPHVVSILDAQSLRPPHYLVMPWLEGRTLESLLREASSTSLSTSFTLWIARQVAQALDALQRAGWVHADVKPANLMISSAGHATLIDLGLARRPADEGATPAVELVGTPWYMAPEMLLGVGSIDARSDLYSLGALMYEMLTGRVPFPAQEARTLVEAHRAGEPTPLRELAPHTPAPVARLVHSLLAKEPMRRPQAPGELLRELLALEIAHFGEDIARDA